jgi:hypothetical protein
MNANTFLSEELASHGYVVFSIGHPYWCEFYYDAEGKTTPLDKNNEYYKKLWEEEGSWQVLKIKKEITLAKTLEDRPDLYRKLNQAMPTEVSDRPSCHAKRAEEWGEWMRETLLLDMILRR